MWYHSKLPKNIIDSMVDELSNNDKNLNEGMVLGYEKLPVVDYTRRKSKTTFISGSHWIGGFCSHYINLANNENFGYDIEGFGNNVLQYSSYGVGEYYNWHVDASVSDSLVLSGDQKEKYIDLQIEKIRKLSITVQLSDPEEYSGGEFQFLTDEGETVFAPKEKGTIIIFDSRLRHRVRKVRNGSRKSLVGWVVGPRWK